MGGFLKQATASQVRAIGPFVDDTDAKTAETALTIANTDIKLIVNGGASANKNSGGGTHRANGVYGVTFDATDTATVGEMKVSVSVAGALPFFDTWTVVEEAIYDLLFAASATGAVSIATGGITSASFAASAINNAALAPDTGLKPDRANTAQAGGVSTITLDAAASAVDNYYRYTQIRITGGTGVGQTRRISSYVGATRVATVDLAWSTVPDNTSTFVIFPAADGATEIAAAVLAAAVLTPISASIASNVKTNQALANFEFLMTDNTLHAPATGLTVTCTRSIDGGAFAGGTLSGVTEISNGLYKVNFGASDLNGRVVVLRATATGCDDTFERLITQP